MSSYSISLLLAVSANFLVGVFVFFKRRKDPTAQTFLLLTIVLTLWLLGCFGESISESKSPALFWDKILYTGVVLYPLTYFNFLFSILNIKKNKKVLSILGAISLSFLFLNYSPWRYYLIRDVEKIFPFRFIAVPNIFWFVLVSYVVISVVFGALLKFKIFYKSTGVKRNQLKYLLTAYIVLTCGGSLYFLLPLSIKIPPIDAALVVVFSVVIAFAILRYRLMDIYVAIKRTAAYSLSAGLLMAFFVVIVLSITNLLSAYADVDSFKVSIFAALVIALLFNPLRNKMQILVDKVFYKKSFDYYDTIRKVSHDLASILDLKNIYSFVGDIVFSTMGLKNIYMLSASAGRDYEVVYSRSSSEDKVDEEKKVEEALKIEKNSNLVKLLRTSDDVVIKDELPEVAGILGQEVINNISAALKPFNGEAVMPVFVDDKLELLLILGGKLSGDIFTDEDIKLLDTISHQTSISVKNAKLYREKLSSEKLASIGMMSATFAHEIKNPLTSIKTFAQMMPEKHADDDFRDSFSKVVVGDIERIDRLIKDLLDFSSSRALPCIDNVEVTALVDEVLEYIEGRLELEKKDISVEKSYKNVKILMLGDSHKLKQAFINLINNSCQAMREKGMLKVNITQNGLNVDVKISDTGRGIPQKDIEKIFDPFYTTRPMGVGLGLAISKKIIEDHGGSIAVESKLSKGTTFTVSLPVKNN